MLYSPPFYLRRFAGLFIALFASWLITTLIGERDYPIGWIYISLFMLAGLFTFVARGTYLWIAAVWSGAMVMLLLGQQDYPGGRWPGAIIIGVQYLSAVLTGGLLGQWLRYRLALSRNKPLPLVPTAHMLLVSGGFLLLLPFLAFLLLARVSIQNESPATILMFIPGNTPFLVPALLTGALCGYWVSRVGGNMTDRRWARILLVVSLVLVVMALLLRFIFGYLELQGLLP